MITLYDGNGNAIEISGNTTTEFSIKNYAIAKDENGNNKRSGTLVYGDNEIFPKTTQEMVVNAPKQYDHGVMIALGDSYTVGVGSRWDIFATKHGLICDHQGLVGSAIHSTGTEDEELIAGTPLDYQIRMDKFIANYTGEGQTISDKTYIASDVKLITVMGGANDGWLDVALGTSIYDTDKSTLYGGCHYIFSKLLINFPNADIVCILQPIQWLDATATTGLKTDEDAQKYGFPTCQNAKNLDGLGYGNFVSVKAQKIVKECAEWYGIPICDCVFNWHKRIGSKDNALWTSDGHMTATGYDAIITQLEKTVDNLLFTRN